MNMQSKLGNYFKAINLSNPILLVFILGAVIRLYNSWFTFYINSDGVLYINQAKMIYFGRWDLLPASGISYLANYPFFIAGSYLFLQDWLLAAKATSFAFGSLTLVPLYLLFRRFFTESISLLGTLLFAFVPVFVTRSADVIRDPVYWFFMVTGLYLFTFYRHPRYPFYLMLSNLSFLMATWARIEAFLFILVTALFILISVRKKLKKSLCFLAPVLSVIALVYLLALITGINMYVVNRVPEIVTKFALPLKFYKSLGADIEMFRSNLSIDHRLLYQFIDNANNFAWLVALATLVNHFMEGFFHPYFLVLIVGIPGIFRRFREEPLFWYFLLLIVFGWSLVYCHVLLSWNVDSRFLAIVMLPIFIFIGYGFEKIVNYLQKKFALDVAAAMAGLCFLILLAGLPKNMYYREADKVVFRQIGEYVAQKEQGNTEYISVSSAGTLRQFAFYSNSNNPDLIFPDLALGQLDPHNSTPRTYEEFISYFKKYNIKYFLWEQKFWLRQPFKVLHNLNSNHFLELRRWYHPDTGKLILFKVTL